MNITFKYDIPSDNPYHSCHFFARNRRGNSVLVFISSKLFPFTTGMGKIRQHYSNYGYDGHRRHRFFSSQREKRRTELTEHYKRINENVFKSWSDDFATLECNAGTLPYSFIRLYTNVVSIIKSPGRYDEAKSQLGSYCNDNRILNDLERLEENHNQQVASLITTLHKDNYRYHS
jgi:hypothetical protein